MRFRAYGAFHLVGESRQNGRVMREERKVCEAIARIVHAVEAFGGTVKDQERRDRDRLELFHRADRMAVTERVAVIPIVYGRSLAIVKPWVHGWWEFGKSSSSFADLRVDDSSPRARL